MKSLPGAPAYAMAFDGANMWALGSYAVSKLRVSDGALLPDSDKRIDWNSLRPRQPLDHSNDNTVIKLRASDGTILGTFPTGSIPEGIGFDGYSVWIGNVGEDTVTRIRTSDGANPGTFASGAFPQGVGFDGANIWVRARILTALASSSSLSRARGASPKRSPASLTMPTSAFSGLCF